MLSEFSLVPLAELILNFQELVIDSAEKLLSLVSCDLHILGNGLMPCLIMLWFAGRIGEEAMLDSWNISFLQSCVIDGNSFYSYILMSSGHFPVKSWSCFGSSENKKRDFGPFLAVKKKLVIFSISEISQLCFAHCTRPRKYSACLKLPGKREFRVLS